MAEMPELFLVRDPKPVEKRLGGSASRRGQRERPGAGIVNHRAGMRSPSRFLWFCGKRYCTDDKGGVGLSQPELTMEGVCHGLCGVRGVEIPRGTFVLSIRRWLARGLSHLQDR